MYCKCSTCMINNLPVLLATICGFRSPSSRRDASLLIDALLVNKNIPRSGRTRAVRYTRACEKRPTRRFYAHLPYLSTINKVELDTTVKIAPFDDEFLHRNPELRIQQPLGGLQLINVSILLSIAGEDSQKYLLIFN